MSPKIDGTALAFTKDGVYLNGDPFPLYVSDEGVSVQVIAPDFVKVNLSVYVESVSVEDSVSDQVVTIPPED